MDLHVFTPPIANQTDALGFGLTALTEAIAQLSPEQVRHGLLGGEFGYGAEYENDTFMMRPYCWCERTDCLWCTVWLSNEGDFTEEESKAHREKQEAEIAAKFGADSYRDFGRAPNFWHKRSGLKVNWYKWIGRDMEVHNPNAADLHAVMRECLHSVSA